MMEKFIDIEGFNGRYQISNYGRVKSFTKKAGILKPSIMRGYEQISLLTQNGNKKTIRIHRLVANAFITNPYNKAEVNHIDGNKKNNNISNLEWASHSENIKHAYKIGLLISPVRKLSDEDVKNIFLENMSTRKLAIKYNTSKSTTAAIKRGISYKSITDKLCV